MRLGNRIDEGASNGDEHEAWGSGFEIGRTMLRLAPSRHDVEGLLSVLGLDTSDEAMARLGYAPGAAVSASE